jgi:peptidoglycan hydrolase-like protein with peptidoglycan-binding domain
MKIDQAELKRQVALARSRGWGAILGQAEQRHKLPAGILLAIASRETNMEDIVGDGGHGRGLFQIDDRAHGDWLAQHGAGGPGTIPPLAEAAELAATLLDQNRAFAKSNGVAADHVLVFAVSAYNAGPGGALAGHRSGDSDRRTTGGDYGHDVLERLDAIQKPGENGGPVPAAVDGILRRGSRGAGVTKLKRDLQACFEQQAPGEWRTFGVAPGPAFGPALDRAVRAFQERNGLIVDGEVGPQTLAAVAAAVSGL